MVCCVCSIPTHTVGITGYTVAPGLWTSLLSCLSSQYQHSICMRLSYRQCSSGLQAVADVAAAIKAGFYKVGLAGGVEAMSQTPMAWEGGVNPRAAKNKKAMSCLIPMGTWSMWALLCGPSFHLPAVRSASTVALCSCNLWQYIINHVPLQGSLGSQDSVAFATDLPAALLPGLCCWSTLSCCLLHVDVNAKAAGDSLHRLRVKVSSLLQV